MKPVEALLRKMRGLWLLEHSARRLILAAGWALDAWLLCLLLHRALGLRMPSALLVGLLALVAGAAIILVALASAPARPRLAQLLDDRAGTHDLFASALEFKANPERFGWLGGLTCQAASAEAGRTVLRPRWALGPLRHCVAVGALGALLAAAYAGMLTLEAVRPRGSGSPAVASREAAASDARGKAAQEAEKSVAEAPKAQPPGERPAEQEKPPEETVKITNEMIDKYLAQVPQQPIDLEGVTPIRWDDEEASGKANPQNERREGEKIDPVKLGAALLKDLQDAKKTKVPGKQEGGVDVAVIGESNQESKAKGKPGGKDDKGSLAGAVSKDPRGRPTRMAVGPPRAGMEIRSAARSPVKQPGQERPMGLLDFLAAMRRAQAAAGAPAAGAAPQAGGTQDQVIHQEPVPDAAGVVESYFGRLRKADR